MHTKTKLFTLAVSFLFLSLSCPAFAADDAQEGFRQAVYNIAYENFSKISGTERLSQSGKEWLCLCVADKLLEKGKQTHCSSETDARKFVSCMLHQGGMSKSVFLEEFTGCFYRSF